MKFPILHHIYAVINLKTRKEEREREGGRGKETEKERYMYMYNREREERTYICVCTCIVINVPHSYLTCPGLNKIAPAGTNFVSTCLHNSMNNGFSK